MRKTILYPLLALAAGFTMIGTALVIAQDPAMEPQEPAEPTPEAVAEASASETAEAPAPLPADTQPPPDTPAEEPTAPASATELPPAEEINGTAEFVEMVEDEIVIPEPETRYYSETISITLDDVEMVDVVRMFTRISGANIIATPTQLVGRVTVNLTDVGWKPAMDSILDMHNLQLVEKIPGSGVYSILQRQPGAPEPMIVETVFLNYATVSMVEPVVRNMLTSGGTISSFPSRNAMIIRTTVANLEQIKQIVPQIDIMQQQVFIETKFIEIVDGSGRDFGLNWQMLEGFEVGVALNPWSYDESKTWDRGRTDSFNQFQDQSRDENYTEGYNLFARDYVTSDRSTVTEPVRDITDTRSTGRRIESDVTRDFSRTATEARGAVLSASDFRLVMSALEQARGVSVVSNPKIIVANEEEAIIHIGQRRRPFESQVTTVDGAIRTTYNPGAPVDIGVKLTVVPTVNTMSNITVRIEPELTSFDGDETAPDGQTYPILRTKTIKTSFGLRNNETVAIGGLTNTEEREESKSIPLLGSIPILGKWFFSHTSSRRQQEETIIFVTLSIATPEHIQHRDGLPQDTALTRRHMLRTRSEQYEFQRKMEEMEAAVEAQISEREASRLE